MENQKKINCSFQSSVSVQEYIKAEINNEKRDKLQKLLNEAVVCTFHRIRQLTGVDIPSTHTIARCCRWFKTNSVISNDVEMSKSMVKHKIQDVMNELEDFYGEKIFYPAQNWDVVRLEEMIISSIIQGTVSDVLSSDIVSRFLWIVHRHMTYSSYEEMENNTKYISYNTFCELNKDTIRQKVGIHKWEGYVMDAALLAKTKAEKEYGMPLSMNINEYPISGRTIKYINDHSEIGIKEIKDTLQRALDVLLFMDRGDGSNKYRIRSREARWFCELFSQNKGAILIEIPKLDTPRKIIYECLRKKTLSGEITPKSGFKEELLIGKQIYCYNRNARINGEPNVPIFVTRGVTTCQRHGHILANVTAFVKTVDGKNTISLPVQKCLSCQVDRFFIQQTVLDNYENQHGILYFRHLIDSEKFFCDSYAWLCYSTESLLHKLGYNVNANNSMSSVQRQTLLAHIIQERQLFKSDIMRHIDMLIRQHTGDERYINALSKWKSDLNFLANMKDSNEVYNGYLYR